MSYLRIPLNNEHVPTTETFFLQIILASIFLYLELGVAIFAGISALLLIVPINVVGGQFVKNWEASKLEAKGEMTTTLYHHFQRCESAAF